jgi:hypothetical protein
MEQYRNQEVFIVTGSEEDDRSELFVTDKREMVDEYLLLKDPSIDDDVRVFHGVLTTAEFLPSSFHGKSAFLVINCPDKLDQGCVVEAGETPDEVSNEIEAILESADPLTYGDLSIDYIFLLYGYQLGLGMAINEDDIDDEVIFSAEVIADETMDVEDAVLEKNNGGK